jgi:hypothetical protein
MTRKQTKDNGYAFVGYLHGAEVYTCNKIPKGKMWFFPEKQEIGMKDFHCTYCGETFTFCSEEEITNHLINCRIVFPKIKPQKLTEDKWYILGGIEPQEFVEAWAPFWGKYAYHIGVIIKYLTRFLFKNGREDILKAIYYANRLLVFYDEQRVAENRCDTHD